MNALRYLTLCVALCVAPYADAGDIAIAIHGGAGTIERADLSADQERQIRLTLETALRAGHQRLENGASAVDAVTAAIVVLEDSPFFNAGKGAVFTHRGNNTLDASIMDGADRNAGAVAGVSHIRNPILLARRVMDESPHVLLSGAGAEEFALDQGFDFTPAKYFYTEHRWQQLERARRRQTSQLTVPPVEFRFGTVGAVALDKNGNIAAGTSTGGMTNKRYGRIGDSPLIGAGTYADNDTCAVSSTGHGEYFIRAAVAHDIAAQMRYADRQLENAAHDVVHNRLVKLGGTGGIIAIDTSGNIALEHNTAGMYRGSIDAAGTLTTAIYADE
ncbi:MAG: isoaspartyl peptidase/L-asparaginase [Pseudomonadota bacterium]